MRFFVGVLVGAVAVAAFVTYKDRVDKVGAAKWYESPRTDYMMKMTRECLIVSFG